jgi:hypothetical protein
MVPLVFDFDLPIGEQAELLRNDLALTDNQDNPRYSEVRPVSAGPDARALV